MTEDDVEVLHANKTPGMALNQSGTQLILHNPEDPCPAVSRIKEPRRRGLRDEIAPRHELFRLCEACDWDKSREQLQDMLMTQLPRWRG